MADLYFLSVNKIIQLDCPLSQLDQNMLGISTVLMLICASGCFITGQQERGAVACMAMIVDSLARSLFPTFPLPFPVRRL